MSAAIPLNGPHRSKLTTGTPAVRWPWVTALVGVASFALGASLGGLGFTGETRVRNLRTHAATQAMEIRKLQGELELHRLQAERLSKITHFSSQFDVPADLASLIYDVAVFEDLDPELAFRLIRVESGFRRNAVSSKGAIGYTQVLPSTARWLDPTVSRADLFDPETNLHIGFRYLRYLLDEYRGDVRLALLAYNRGPTTVAGLLSLGINPGNGYASAVCEGEPCSEKVMRPGAADERQPLRPTRP